MRTKFLKNLKSNGKPIEIPSELQNVMQEFKKPEFFELRFLDREDLAILVKKPAFIALVGQLEKLLHNVMQNNPNALENLLAAQMNPFLNYKLHCKLGKIGLGNIYSRQPFLNSQPRNKYMLEAQGLIRINTLEYMNQIEGLNLLYESFLLGNKRAGKRLAEVFEDQSWEQLLKILENHANKPFPFDPLEFPGSFRQIFDIELIDDIVQIYKKAKVPLRIPPMLLKIKEVAKQERLFENKQDRQVIRHGYHLRLVIQLFHENHPQQIHALFTDQDLMNRVCPLFNETARAEIAKEHTKMTEEFSAVLQSSYKTTLERDHAINTEKERILDHMQSLDIVSLSIGLLDLTVRELNKEVDKEKSHNEIKEESSNAINLDLKSAITKTLHDKFIQLKNGNHNYTYSDYKTLRKCVALLDYCKILNDDLSNIYNCLAIFRELPENKPKKLYPLFSKNVNREQYFTVPVKKDLQHLEKDSKHNFVH